MITALIRLETRNATASDQKRFERLAGRLPGGFQQLVAGVGTITS
jgi:hypothetical protein